MTAMSRSKVLCMVICILLVVLSVVPAMANSLKSTLTVSGGTVKASCSATVDSGCTSSTKISIQKKVDGVWQRAGSGSGTKNASASGSASGATEYRATAVLTVYKDGKQVDKLTVTSYK